MNVVNVDGQTAIAVIISSKKARQCDTSPARAYPSKHFDKEAKKTIFVRRMTTGEKLTRALPILFVAGLLAACSAVKFIPEGEYMLESVAVKSSDKELDVSQLKGYIRQHPNSKWFSLVKVPMAPYALSGTDTTRRINRFLQRMGEAPVIFDTLLARRTGENMIEAVRNMGWLNASLQQKRTIKGKKVKVLYEISTGTRYHIRNIDVRVPDTTVARLMADNAQASLIQPRMPFDLNVLDAERSRINTLLHNEGYYKFNKEYIRFDADTCTGNHQADITLRVTPYKATAESPDTLHPRYSVRNVSFLAHSYSASEDTTKTDTLIFNGFPIYYHNKLPFRPTVFADNNAIQPNKLYKETDIQTTYGNFGRLGAVMFSNVRMEEADSLPETLDAQINVHQNKPHSISFELEGTNSAGDLGAAAQLTYQNRNLFHGSELLAIKLRGAFEAITGLEGYSDQDYVEASVEASLTFPNARLPQRHKHERGQLKATTEVSLLYDSQNRPEFHRRVVTGALRYRWQSPNSLFRHRLDLIDLNYVFMPWISDTFREDYLEDETDRNAILRYNYEDLFILHVGYSFSYSSQRSALATSSYGSNALSLRFNIEAAGNGLYGASKLFGVSKNSDGQYTLFNIAYAQYIKGDFDLSKSFRIDNRNSLALHFALGIAYPYGNSTILPYEKRYFSGGANSVRGWSVRELGPGSFSGSDGRIDFINQTGDIKLDMNVELRTALFWKFHGALFVDAGNIWTIRDYEEQPGGQFNFADCWRQIAVAYGLGLRLNFDYFVLRLDGGMKAINPAYDDARHHYPIIHPQFHRDFTLHFAVGLPF